MTPRVGGQPLTKKSDSVGTALFCLFAYMFKDNGVFLVNTSWSEQDYGLHEQRKFMSKWEYMVVPIEEM